jgi:hypothetical protein
VPSDRFENSAARSALVAVSALMALAIAQPALGQALGRSRVRPLAPLSGPAPPQEQLNLTIPAGKAEGFRGALSDKQPPNSGAANYGAPRPRVKLPKPYPKRFVGAPPPFSPRNPLPPLEPYKTSAQARHALRPRPGMAPPPAPPPPVTVAVARVIKTKPKPRIEMNPYDPVGVGIGSLRLTPFLETSYGYDTNPNRLARTSNPTGSRLFRADGGFALKSDWGRHDFQANLRMGYSEYFDNSLASRPDGVGEFTGRYDVTRDTALVVLGRFNLDTQRPGAPAIFSGLPNVTVTSRPIIFSSGVQAGVTQKFSRLELSLRGTFERALYEDARYTDGSMLELSRTNYSGYGGLARAAYELTPDIQPFVEGTLDRRVRDTATDINGFRRDSDGFTVRGGAVARFSGLLRGEISGGYAERDYVDPRLPSLRGPIVDAALIYTPSPLTTVTLRGVSSLSETVVANASGILSRNLSLQVSHDLMRNLTVTAVGAYISNEYQGANIREEGYGAGVRLDYRITRSIAIRGSYAYDRLRSTANGADYTSNVFLIGLRFQL